MLHKSCPVKIKAAGEADGLDDGQFEAIVSVFDNVDWYGDVVRKGAFADTLAEWEASGDPIPIYWSHRMDDPDMNIGHVLEAKEIDKGLWIRGQLDTDPEAGKARQVYRLMKGRRVKQFSFSYDIDDGGVVTEDGSDFYELRKLGLHEVGPTPIGANPDTELLGIKAGDMRELAAAGNTVALRKIRALIDDVLDAKSGDEAGNTESDGKATGGEPDNDEGRKVKSEDPTRMSAADLSVIHAIELAAIETEAAGADTESEALT